MAQAGNCFRSYGLSPTILWFDSNCCCYLPTRWNCCRFVFNYFVRLNSNFDAFAFIQILVSHGGVECGQGINTKVAQVAAHCLNIPLSFISIKRMDNVVGANGICTGGSIASEAVCMGVKKACEKLLARMKPVREELGNPEWTELTQACYDKLIDLSCKTTYNKNEMVEYTIWGCCAAEVEIDLLSGNLQLVRVDILEDTGESMSPGIDLGQVEGAFVMGLGYWLTESLVYGRENGELLTNRTWTYKPPGAKDIPVDFRVTFLRNSSNEGGVLRSKGKLNQF